MGVGVPNKRPNIDCCENQNGVGATSSNDLEIQNPLPSQAKTYRAFLSLVYLGLSWFGKVLPKLGLCTQPPCKSVQFGDLEPHIGCGAYMCDLAASVSKGGSWVYQQPTLGLHLASSFFCWPLPLAFVNPVSCDLATYDDAPNLTT